MKPKVIQHKCVGCGECTYICPVDAIRINSKSGKAHINTKKCVNCGECISACPIKAIKRRK